MTAPKPSLDALPYWPRLLDATQAGAYLGMSASYFLAKVEDGTFAQPIRFGRVGRGGGRALWDRLQLDRDVDRIGGIGPRLLTEDDALAAIGGQDAGKIHALRHRPPQ